MSNRTGDYIWYELLTTEPDAAARFYTRVVGWSVRDAGMGGGHDYRLLSAADADVGGLMKLPEGMPSPAWLGYVGVSDVDAAAARIRELGGAIHVPPTDIPGVGRFTLAADPQGAFFYVMRGDSDQPSTAFKAMAKGHCGWNELLTSDQQGALEFYGQLFGWEKGDAMPMGELGDYQFLLQGGEMIGAVMNRPTEGPPPMWNYYFRVGGIDAAAERIRENGGAVVVGPMEVPGGDWIVSGRDPQGGMFALVGPKSEAGTPA